MIYCSCTFCVPAQNVIPLSHGFELASVSHPELPSCAKVPTWKVTPTTSTETSKERSTQKQWTGWMMKMEEKPKLQEPLKFGIEKILYGSSNPAIQATACFAVHSRQSTYCTSQKTKKMSSEVSKESFGEHLSVLDSPPNCSNKRYQSLPWSRPVFTSDQRTTLEHHFQLQHYLTKRERYFLSLHLGLTEHQIKIWFQNRRVKHRNAVKEEKQRTRNTCVRGGVTFLPREQHE